MTARTVTLVASLVSSGLIAGLFFGWMVSVIPGTSVVDDRSYIVTMQNINRQIINPAFVITFIATPAILAVAAVVHFRAGQTRRAALLIAATATYLFGVIGVTAGGNIPLNDALEAFDLSEASPTETSERRNSYESPWNRWHNLRTFASIAALGLTALAGALAEAD